MAGWNLWVWLQYIGVASRCCCKEVYRYPHNTNTHIAAIAPLPLTMHPR